MKKVQIETQNRVVSKIVRPVTVNNMGSVITLLHNGTVKYPY